MDDALASTREPVVALNQVTRHFGSFCAVDNLSFSVGKGEIFGFLGPNGAGKTTTLRMILDIIRPSSGTLTILGSSSAIAVRHKIGYLPEERGLYRKMRAARTIAYFGRLRGLDVEKAKERAMSLLKEFGLEEFSRTKNESLSKGMAQKIQLLATLVHEPDLLILDEPFSGLDPINQQLLENIIRRLRDQGRTIIFSTHVMEHAERLCDRFLILGKGQKRFEGTLSQARGLFAPKLRLRTRDDVSALVNVPGVLSIIKIDTHYHNDDQERSEISYELELECDADFQLVLHKAIEAGIKLTQFEQVNMSLHDLFVSLAGDENKESEKDEAKDGAPGTMQNNIVMEKSA